MIVENLKNDGYSYYIHSFYNHVDPKNKHFQYYVINIETYPSFLRNKVLIVAYDNYYDGIEKSLDIKCKDCYEITNEIRYCLIDVKDKNYFNLTVPKEFYRIAYDLEKCVYEGYVLEMLSKKMLNL